MKGSKNPEDKETRFAVEGEEEGHGELYRSCPESGFLGKHVGKEYSRNRE